MRSVEADDLAAYAITTGAFYEGQCLLARHKVTPQGWARFITEAVHPRYDREVERGATKLEADDLHQCAETLKAYYEHHVAEMEREKQG